MSYFLKGLKDVRFWMRVTVIPLIGALNLVDILSSALAPPGYFNLWVVRISLIIGIPGIIVLGVILGKTESKQKLEMQAQQKLEESKKIELARIAESSPDFQTLCHLCRFFSQEAMACEKKIYNLESRRVRFKNGRIFCLHWEEKSGVPPDIPANRAAADKWDRS